MAFTFKVAGFESTSDETRAQLLAQVQVILGTEHTISIVDGDSGQFSIVPDDLTADQERQVAAILATFGLHIEH